MPKHQVLHPKYWPLWLLLAVFWCLAKLPRNKQTAVGRGIGRLIVRLVPKLQRVINANLRACFTELDEVDLLIARKETAEEQGVSIIETFWVWFNDTNRILPGHFEIEGYEHLESALSEGRGIIVLACHHGAVDVNGALLSKVDRRGKELVGTYRETDEIINQLLRRWRCRFIDRMISAGDQRGMVRALRKGNLVWYAPDIEVKNKASAFVNFMGVKASTTLAVSRLAKAANAVVIPFGHYRMNDQLHYKARFYPPIDGFPSDDLEADARKVNEAIEAIIEPQPFRYWWAIKRFKHRPEGEAKIY